MILSELMKDCFDEGQSFFVDSIKQALYRQDDKIFDRIDFYNDAIYLEPLLFNHLTKGRKQAVTLSQILFIHLDKSQPVKVYSNKYGQIYVTNNSYLKTSYNQKLFEFHDNRLRCDDIETIEYQQEPCTYIGSTNIELCAYEIPGLDRFYQNWNTSEKVQPVTSGDPIFSRSKALIESAFQLIKAYSQEFYDYCLRSTQKIVLFQSSEIPGFVTREAHGVIYLSVHDDISLAFFIDEIVHQCGHNIFNAITCNLKEFINIDPSTRLQELVGHDKISDTSLDGAYHGLFTVCAGIQVLNGIYESTNLDTRNEHELKGRLGVKGRRFRTWTEDVKMSDLFSPKGIKIYEHLDMGADQVIERSTEVFKLDFSNQPYAFSYGKFKEANEI